MLPYDFPENYEGIKAGHLFEEIKLNASISLPAANFLVVLKNGYFLHLLKYKGQNLENKQALKIDLKWTKVNVLDSFHHKFIGIKCLNDAKKILENTSIPFSKHL